MQAEVSALLERALEQHRDRQFARAAELYDAVLEARPTCADALHLSGVARHQLGDADEGLRRVERAIALRPAAAVYHENHALMLLDLGRAERASDAFARARELRAALPPSGGGPDARYASLSKLRHDAEQLRYLHGLGLGPPQLADLAERYDACIQAHSSSRPAGACEDASAVFELDDAALAAIGDAYNRPLHVAPAPCLPGGTLSAQLDAGRVERCCRHAEPPVAVVDGLLVPEALERLRRFCLESTFWSEFRYRGYLGVRLDRGLASPLVLQLACELRQRLPGLLGPHRLEQVWAFSYDPDGPGIAPHADAAAVNVNLWLTPDDACLEPLAGGLVLHDCEAPADWAFARYNRDPEAIRALLRDCGRGSLRVPHRQNRAVVFRSRLFHETDRVPFRPGFENRRINLTLLYGAGS